MNYFDRKKRLGAGSQFWMADTISYADVLAAYRFKGALTEDSALTNLAKNDYKLINTNCSWSKDNGFEISMKNNKGSVSNAGHCLDNSSLRTGSAVKSMVMRISNGNFSKAMPLTTFGEMSVWGNTAVGYSSFYWDDYEHGIGVAHQNGLSVDYKGSTSGSIPRNRVRVAHAFYNDGVIGINLNSAGSEALFSNGNAISLANAVGTASSAYSKNKPWSAFIASEVPRLIGGYLNNSTSPSGQSWSYVTNHYYSGSFNVLAMACFSRVITQAEYQQIYKNMLSI